MISMSNAWSNVDDWSADGCHDHPSITLSKSMEAIQPTWLFRQVGRIYADRKVVLLASFHVVASVVVFVHFALTKVQSQQEKISPDASFYSAKIGVPAFEFGTMHVILFQLAVLPLTMCRLLITNAACSSNRFLSSYIPFGAMTKFHIAIGYAVMVLLLVSTIVFFIFFGALCSSGEQDFCDKFSSEIMVTGYFIFLAFMTVGISSYLRFKIPYRIFYIIHHVVFLAYFLCILHTLDSVQRQKGGRSQAFKWLSSSILLYCCDRAAMYMTQRYKTKIIISHAIDSGENERCILLKANKPNLLQFSPGQFVYLKVPSVDNRWRPFSIGSAPESETIEFYIKVSNDTSWSGQLFVLINDLNSTLDAAWNDDVGGHGLDIDMEILGPYGTPLGEKMDHSHALLIGTGTGFVPCMSFLQDHISQCQGLDPFFHQRKEHDKKRGQDKENIESSHLSSTCSMKCQASPKLSLFVGSDAESKVSSSSAHTHSDSLAKISRDASIAKHQLYGWTLILLGPIVGIWMLGITLSWNNFSPFTINSGMSTFLAVGSVAFQLAFLLSSIIYWKRGSSLWYFIDIVIYLISLGTDSYWSATNRWGNFNLADLVYFSLLTGYMTIRFWSLALASGILYRPIQGRKSHKNRMTTYEKVEFVWICRSAASIAHIYPDLALQWSRLVEAWGEERAREACEISLYCTDPNINVCQQLADEIQDTILFKEGALKFYRPSIRDILAHHTGAIIDNEDTESTSTLFAFCGSEVIGNSAKEAKLFNDTQLAMNGRTRQIMDIVIQSHGSLNQKEASQREMDDNEKESNDGDDDGDSCTQSTCSHVAKHGIIPIQNNAIDVERILSRSHSFRYAQALVTRTVVSL
uniref:FAD-binding FR-type domain-containing protein n=1 Tax=Chaetoceros debilis TaxID=122233 RepID=A0A7S3PTV5_9STRA|mmetsp:Transcript_22144/g.33701  ORF Transcript_22144/g.33701 Transcript_22144/m.33701 type:complete len:862 (+) Transcript_22144:65-2650(+)